MLSPIISVCMHAFISGVYAGFIHSAISIFIYDKYKNVAKTTLANIAFWPADLRMFWIPFLDNINLGFVNFGSKKNLIIISDLLICIIFYFMYSYTFNSFLYLILFLALLGFVMAIRDSVSVGYKLEFFSKEIIWEYEGKISGYYNFGLCLGGPLMFMLSTFFSWLILFKVLHIVFLISSIFNFFIANSKKYEVKKYQNIKEKFKKPYQDLLLNKFLFTLIGFIITYKLAGKFMMGTISLFLLEFGVSKFHLSVFKIVAGLLTVVIVSATSLITNYFGKKRAIILSLICYAIVPISFIFCLLTNNFLIALYLCLIEKILRGMQSNFLFLAQSQCLSGEYAMVQISILSCLERLSGRFITSISGYIVEFFKSYSFIIIGYDSVNLSSKVIGWIALFLVVLLTMIPAILFTYIFLNTDLFNDEFLLNEKDKLTK